MLYNFKVHIVPSYNEVFKDAGARKRAANVVRQSKEGLSKMPTFTSKKRRIDNQSTQQSKRSRTSGGGGGGGDRIVDAKHAAILYAGGYDVEARREGHHLSYFADNISAPGLIGKVRMRIIY